MLALAPLTLPTAGFQVHQGVQLSTDRASFGGRLPSIDVDNLLTVFRRKVFEFQMERIGRDIRYLSSPQAFHSLKREGFKHKDVMSEYKVLG